MRVFRRLGVLMVMVTILLMAQPALAIHFYRGTGSGCSAADGQLSDDPVNGTGEIAAEVQLWHNSFYDPEAPITESNVTRINVGDAVKWTWNSAHCHSVQDSLASPSINSGFHYPTFAPDSPKVVPGFFEYPVLTDDPTLSFVHTFTQPGTYSYFCIHHVSIGMSATVIVE